jgi:hypothetical protein
MPEETRETPPRPEEVLKRQVADRFKQRIAEIRGKISALERDLKDRIEAEATLRIVLEGDGGGTWFVNIKNGEVEIGQSPAGEPILTVYQSLADFQAAAGEIGGLGLGGGPGGQGELTKSRISRIRAIKGTLQFKVTDLADGREMSVITHFGPGERAAEPQATVSIHADNARKMRTGELNPQQAFMSGMIRISGDTALVMSVGMAMMM